MPTHQHAPSCTAPSSSSSCTPHMNEAESFITTGPGGQECSRSRSRSRSARGRARRLCQAQPGGAAARRAGPPAAIKHRRAPSGGQAVQSRAELSCQLAPAHTSSVLLGEVDALLDGGAQLGHHGLEPRLLVVVQLAQPVDLLHACITSKDRGWDAAGQFQLGSVQLAEAE